MNRLWLGIGVLAALLGCSLWVTGRSGKVHGDISQRLEQAAQAALAEDWPAVAVMTEQIHRRWDDNLRFSTAFSEHSLLDEVEAGIARLEVYLSRHQASDYAAQSAALARRVEALEEAHRLSWNNLL